MELTYNHLYIFFCCNSCLIHFILNLISKNLIIYRGHLCHASFILYLKFASNIPVDICVFQIIGNFPKKHTTKSPVNHTVIIRKR